ncbi:hypothetical protein [Hyphococcus sp.]|uniref:hypothetical protein n=1 Tax=Hyphococcus sp. TaxID=2038636 RepID=UPI003D0C61CB
MDKVGLVSNAVDASIASWEALKANPYIEASPEFMNFAQSLLKMVEDKQISQSDAAFPLLLSTIAGLSTLEETSDLERLLKAATNAYSVSEKIAIGNHERNCLKSIVAQMLSRNFNRDLAAAYPSEAFDRTALGPEVLRFLNAYELRRGKLSRL